MSAPRAALALLLLAGAGQVAAQAIETGSAQYRLIAPGVASVATRTESPAYSLLVVGGAGQAVGIAAGMQNSVVGGGTSVALPTSRVFRDGLEARDVQG